MKKGASLAVLDHPCFLEHVPQGNHPEGPARLLAMRRAVSRASDVGLVIKTIGARPATKDELLSVHSEHMVEHLYSFRDRQGFLEDDTYVSPRSVSVAEMASGGALSLIDDLVLNASAAASNGLFESRRRGLALLRPPGHHATRDRSMGFCLVNHVALAAVRAQKKGLQRIAIVDWDVHHGNGTQHIFEEDPSVIYISIHQSPCYPGTGQIHEVGKRNGVGYTINIPLSPGAKDSLYRGAFERIVLPIVDEYKPELILVSAGFDASSGDPLAEMDLSPGAFAYMARTLSQLADKHAQGKMALFVEGGYDLASLEEGLLSAILGLFSDEKSEESEMDHRDIDLATAVIKKYWPKLS